MTFVCSARIYTYVGALKASQQLDVMGGLEVTRQDEAQNLAAATLDRVSCNPLSAMLNTLNTTMSSATPVATNVSSNGVDAAWLAALHEHTKQANSGSSDMMRRLEAAERVRLWEAPRAHPQGTTRNYLPCTHARCVAHKAVFLPCISFPHLAAAASSALPAADADRTPKPKPNPATIGWYCALALMWTMLMQRPLVWAGAMPPGRIW